MRSRFVFGLALVVGVVVSSHWARSVHACTLPAVTGLAGSVSVPPTSFITGVVANGTNILTVYTTNVSTGVQTSVLLNLGNNSGMTATGSWGGVGNVAHLTSLSSSSNQLIFNGGAGTIVLSGATISGSFALLGTGAGVTQLLASGGGTLRASGYNAATTSTAAASFFFTGTCQVTVTESGNSGLVSLAATAAEATQVQFLVDSNIVGTDSSVPFAATYDSSLLTNGIHTLSAIATFANGSLNSGGVNFLTSNTVVSAGYSHSCAVVSGAAKCWGYNDFGQLGTGDTTQSLVPIDVSGLSSGVTQVVTGGAFSCALVSGGVKCWGYNAYGELGNGTSTNSLSPVDVSGLTSGVQAIAGGYYSACALTTAGAVKCWGQGRTLGNGGTANSNIPVPASGLTSGVQVLASGSGHSCAITNVGGALKCWGFNTWGQVGNATSSDQLTPVQIYASGVRSIGLGYGSTCASVGGAAKCWGLPLGNGTSNQSNVPVAVTGLASNVQTLSAGGTAKHSCAITAGSLKCWGWNYAGQIGNGTSGADVLTPAEVISATTGVVNASAGYAHSCATISGHVKCWGDNSGGQLGNGTTTSALTPQLVTGL